MEKQAHTPVNVGALFSGRAALGIIRRAIVLAKTEARILAAVCALCLLIPASALAGAAYPGELSMTEKATGVSVQIYNHGDEFFNYITDAQGRLLVTDGAGYLRHVVSDGESYVLGGYVTQNRKARSVGQEVTENSVSAERLQALWNEISAATPKAFSEGSRIGDIPDKYDFVGDAAAGRVHLNNEDEDKWMDDISNYPEKESTCALLVLRVQFDNLPGVFSDLEWHNRIFEGGITDYYSTVSNGKFTYKPVRETAGTPDDGVVTVTLPFPALPYVLAGMRNQNMQNDPEAGLYRGSDNQNYAIYNMGSIFAYALLLAENSVNFSDYDRNGDHYISPTELAVLVVYTGYEASYAGMFANEGEPAAWAHSWKYNNILSTTDESTWHYMSVSVDGVKFFKYTVIGELLCAPGDYDLFEKTGTPRQAQFGTACHELGHDLGLMDLYPTNGAWTSDAVGVLSLMGTGNWGSADDEESGSSPTHLDPYSKRFLGFYDAETIVSDGVYTLHATEPSAQYNVLRINTDNPDVYYLLENRENTGFDQGLQYRYYVNSIGGIVFWRIDEAVLKEKWVPNTINNEDGHYGIMPVFIRSDNGATLPFWSIRISHDNYEELREDGIPVVRMSMPAAAMTLELGKGNVPLSIARQPEDAYVTVGQRASFSVSALGDNLQYKWYQCQIIDEWMPDDSEWTAVPGAESAEFLTAETTLQDDGTLFYCSISNEYGFIMTKKVALHVRKAVTPPKTGDDSMPLAWLCMCLLGGLGLAHCLLRRRRHV